VFEYEASNEGVAEDAVKLCAFVNVKGMMIKRPMTKLFFNFFIFKF
jgi:hypothetical protein